MAAPALSPLPANWATGAFRSREISAAPAQPTQFEIVVKRLQLENLPHLWAQDEALRAWVKTNKNRRYVPEQLLDRLGMYVVMED